MRNVIYDMFRYYNWSINHHHYQIKYFQYKILNIQLMLLKNPCTEKNSLRNFTQLLSKVGTYGQVGDYLILL